MFIIENEIISGDTRRIGNFDLTPVSQVLKVRIPGYHAGLVWNRPRAVVVRDQDGIEQTLPVIDVTRVAIWAMLAGGLFGALVLGLRSRRR